MNKFLTTDLNTLGNQFKKSHKLQLEIKEQLTKVWGTL